MLGGANGNIWFEEGSSGNIGPVTPAGVITELEHREPQSDSFCGFLAFAAAQATHSSNAGS